ncbi:MAG: DUF4296 domain-containing protein [Phocaeicola sp.]
MTTSNIYSKLIWVAIFFSLFITACSTGGKPKGFIEPHKMEEVLYDYHLAFSMSNNLPYDERYKKESFQNYVYEKHRITAAQFDSSMVWYMRNTKELTEIYTDITARFKEHRSYLQDLIALRDNHYKGSLAGDTVDVWHGSRLHWLTDYPLTNKVKFEIKSDSNYFDHDAFLWEADLLFLEPVGQQVVVALNIHLSNDSVIGKVERFTNSSHLSIYLKDESDSCYAIKQLNGFIYYMDSLKSGRGMFVNNISLTRYHELKYGMLIQPSHLFHKNDSLMIQEDSLNQKVDSLKILQDSLKQEVGSLKIPKDSLKQEVEPSLLAEPNKR